MKNKIFITILATLFCTVFGYYVLAASKQNITLARSKTVLVKGEKVKLSGKVTPKRKNIEVKIYSKDSKTSQFSLFKTVMTNKKGNYKYGFKPDKTAYYQIKAVVSGKILISKTKKVKVGTIPVLRNLMVNFARYNPVTSRAGAFLFGSSDTQIFMEFGDTVVNDQGPKLLPTFEYRINPESNVYVASYGVVDRIIYQAETSDYEILVRTSDTRKWNVDYDHVVDINVKVGDKVKAGEVLGKAGIFDEGLARTELMISKSFPGGNYHYCPFNYFEPKSKSLYKQEVTDLMTDWETYKNDSTIYDQSAMVVPGCLYHRMVDDGGDIRPAD